MTLTSRNEFQVRRKQKVYPSSARPSRRGSMLKQEFLMIDQSPEDVFCHLLPFRRAQIQPLDQRVSFLECGIPAKSSQEQVVNDGGAALPRCNQPRHTSRRTVDFVLHHPSADQLQGLTKVGVRVALALARHGPRRP